MAVPGESRMRGDSTAEAKGQGAQPSMPPVVNRGGRSGREELFLSGELIHNVRQMIRIDVLGEEEGGGHVDLERTRWQG